MAARARGELFAGLRAAARAAGCVVVGGHTGVAPGPLQVAVAACGHAPARALRRDGARAGDWLHVTGPLGGAAAGRHLRFRPRLAEGLWLARQRAVRACIDVSDGLLLDLWTLLAASGRGLGAELFADALPVASAARGLARRSGRSALEHALADGEDYELLFAVAPRGRLAAGGPLAAAARAPIGRVVAEPGLWLAFAGGRRVAVPPAGFQHDV
jgi:thiamine-monophosphate kinase